jgi:hypothetical protein
MSRPQTYDQFDPAVRLSFNLPFHVYHTRSQPISIIRPVIVPR